MITMCNEIACYIKILFKMFNLPLSKYLIKQNVIWVLLEQSKTFICDKFESRLTVQSADRAIASK